MSPEPWGPLALEVGGTVEKRLGELCLRLRRRPQEVWMLATHDADQERSARGRVVAERPDGEPAAADGRRVPVAEPEEEAWIRWAASPEDGLALKPALPDRPVVVSPEQPFFLPPAGRARVYVRIPLFVRIEISSGEGGATTLEQVPSLVLSDTWWGSFTEGELGYWIETRARREMDPSLYEPYLAICPFILSNGSDQVLPVERFALRVSYLTLFGRDRACWTDEVQVRYEGGPEGSHIRYTGRIPEEAGDVELMAPSREKAPRGLHARTFGKLRSRVGVL